METVLTSSSVDVLMSLDTYTKIYFIYIYVFIGACQLYIYTQARVVINSLRFVNYST